MLCQLDFKNSRKLDQAKVRLATKKERMESETTAQIEEGNSFPEPECSRQLTRSQIPTIHDQHLCVWCMKPDNSKNTRDPFRKMELDAAWNRFKIHTVYIDDENLRDCLVALIDSTPNPFAAEIWYHESCFKRYLRPTYDISDSRTIQIQNIRLPEIDQLFLEHKENY